MLEVWVSGPVVDVVLRGPEAETGGIRAEGLVDTGASIIGLDRRLALQLGLSAISKTPVQIANGTEVMATVYALELEVPGLQFREWVRVAAVTMDFPSTRILLGRSFLRHFVLTYNGGEDLFHWFRLGRSTPDEAYD